MEIDPKFYEIWYSDEGDEAGKSKIPEIFEGFICKKVSDDELDDMEASMRPEARFKNKKLLDAGYDSIYVLKEEFRRGE